MKNPTCCFTGHRKIPAGEYPEIQRRLTLRIIELIHEGVCCFEAGGALGFDTMAALTVLNIKKWFPHIRLILVLPCKEQAERWSKEDKKTYNHILKQADKVVYISEQYDRDCMFRRNRTLVDHSDVCVCCLTANRGGTVYTANYARRKGLPIINLADL